MCGKFNENFSSRQYLFYYFELKVRARLPLNSITLIPFLIRGFCRTLSN